MTTLETLHDLAPAADAGNATRTVGAPMRRALATARDRTAVVCGEQTLTYAELGDRVARLGGLLAGLGLRPGDRVAYGISNGYGSDAELYAALTDFEATYAAYGEFQDRMEHYWCLRWLLQEQITGTTGSVIRDTLVRFDRLPLVVRMPDLPALPPETGVRIAIGRIDLLADTFECRYAGEVDS